MLGLARLSSSSNADSFSGSNGTSEMTARSTCARYAAKSEVSPELRPNSSTMAMRSWEPLGVRSAVMKSTLRVTAVLNPMQ